MHVQTTVALAVAALAASIYLLMGKGERIYPAIAVAASGLWALLALKILHLSITAVRLDLVLALVVLVAGAICWLRGAKKPAVAASTTVVVVALLQVLIAIKFLR